MLTVVPDPAGGDHAATTAAPTPALIDELVREGARRILAEALKAEVDAYIAAFADESDEAAHRLVVRNGRHQPRTVLTSAGAIEVQAPRVNDKRIDEATGERRRFSSSILPPWCRKSPAITEVLPLLYLHGLSTGDFALTEMARKITAALLNFSSLLLGALASTCPTWPVAADRARASWVATLWAEPAMPAADMSETAP